MSPAQHHMAPFVNAQYGDGSSCGLAGCINARNGAHIIIRAQRTFLFFFFMKKPTACLNPIVVAKPPRKRSCGKQQAAELEDDQALH